MSGRLLDDRPPTPLVGGWLLLLCALLIVWEPLSFAASQAGIVASLADRGPLVWLVFGLRVVVLGLGIGAGLAMWNGRSQGVVLARTFFVLSAALSALVIGTTFYPVGLAPDRRAPVLVVTLAYDAVWLVYLYRSARVRRLVET